MGTQISGGKDRGRRLYSISEDIRPTSQKLRLAIFSILSDLPESPRVLDLYAGSGAFGLEALSRGAHILSMMSKQRSASRLLTATKESRFLVMRRSSSHEGAEGDVGTVMRKMIGIKPA